VEEIIENLVDYGVDLNPDMHYDYSDIIYILIKKKKKKKKKRKTEILKRRLFLKSISLVVNEVANRIMK